MDFSDIETLLFHEKRLYRDEGENKLNLVNKDNCQSDLVSFILNLINQLQKSDTETSWNISHGCLLGIKGVLLKYDQNNCEDLRSNFDLILQLSMKNLIHNEARIRLVAGSVIGALCRLDDCMVLAASKTYLVELLLTDLERHGQEDSELSSFSSQEIFHQSAGWRHLETSMKCLQQIIENCKSFKDQVDQSLIELLFKTLHHDNRFVRETGFNVFSKLFNCKKRINENPVLIKVADTISEHLAIGLADNWSQVRLASSKATRNFLLNYSNPQRYYLQLLPRICLNRYYIADGVRIFSQNSWKEICGSDGKKLVESCIAAVVSYYVQSTKANNHAVREAACHCIAELASKIDTNVTRPYVAQLIEALLECFRDDSWPVRDSACISCGNLLLEFPEEVKCHRDVLYKLFLGNLQDPIPSVRAGAAISLGKYVKAYNDEVMTEIVNEIKEGFDFIKTQPQDSDNFVGLDKKPAVFGVVKNLQDPNHTDQIMYSCGSLAPKMSRQKLGGCTDCHFQRPSKPWERSDGCVYFLTELSKNFPEISITLIPDLIKASSYKHFPQHVIFVETICKQIPIFAKAIKKRAFKAHLENFFPIIFYALDSDTQLTSSAAENCLLELSVFVGPGILKGRVEMWNPNQLTRLNRVLQ